MQGAPSLELSCSHHLSRGTHTAPRIGEVLTVLRYSFRVFKTRMCRSYRACPSKTLCTRRLWESYQRPFRAVGGVLAHVCGVGGKVSYEQGRPGTLSVVGAGSGSLASLLRPLLVCTPCLLCVLGKTPYLLSHTDSVALPCGAFLGVGGGRCRGCGGVFGMHKCQVNASRYYYLGGHFW